MTFRTLIRRNLRFHWRAHLGVVLGAAVGSAALIGALVVGDSVRESLKDSAWSRFGEAHFAMASNDHYFRDDLGQVLHESFTGWHWWWDQTNNISASFMVAPATALILPATAVRQDNQSRANHIQIIGFAKNHGRQPPASGTMSAFATNSFWGLRPDGPIGSLGMGEVAVNEALAKQLGAQIGDQIVFRVRKPSALDADSPISPKDDMSVALTLKITAVINSKQWGNFNVHSSPILPLNAFVDLDQLQKALHWDGRANMVLVGKGYFAGPSVLPLSYANQRWLKTALDIAPRLVVRLFAKGVQVPSEAVAKRLKLYLSNALRLEDLQARLSFLGSNNQLVLASSRVFLDEPIARSSLEAASTNAQPILTYLATLLHAGTNATPYSMVTAAGAPWTPADLRDDEIVVSQWLADNLHVTPGDEIAVSYFLPESGAKLSEATNTFRVRSIVPAEMPWADRTLMPDFPGIEKAESTSEWDAGFPLTYKIRPQDEEYWKKYRGTPKAFITLAAGQKMWGNRFGNLTAIRFPVPTNGTAALSPALSPGERENRSQSQSEPGIAGGSVTSKKTKADQRLSPLPGGEGKGEGERQTNFVENYRAALERKILANLKPEEFGLRFEPVREQALKAAEESQDFGGLFLGFSFFVIAAALMLMALLFSLGLEQRAPEIGTLLALGFTPRQVRKLLLREAVVLSLTGGVIGALGGLAYAKAMLHGLATIWRDAVGATALNFHFTAQTLVIGIFASTVVSVVTIWLALRKFVKRPARELLVGEIGNEQSRVQSPKSKVVAAGALLVGLALAGWAVVTDDTANAGAFFGAGALVLIAGLGLASVWLAGMERGTPIRRASGDGEDHQRAESEFGAPMTLASLGVRGCARRRKRSLATMAMLACGSFLIVSIGVFRLDANRDATKRSSGTGGFALIGETTMPVVQDLNSKSGRDFFALNEADLNGVSFVPFRVRAGDEASCLNLNAAQRPRLLGVKPGDLEKRFTFAKGEGWAALHAIARGQSPIANEIPALGDANSIQWAMHKKVGDTIDYVDEHGQPFKVRIVGAVANSILQGQLIIDEAEFVKRFPGASGYRMFLIDAPSNAVSLVSATLSRALQDVGLELTPAAQRLAQFNAVQNTYLGTFQVLGGLGLLLGSAGLGIVVLRNVLERRGELAVLMAVGFRKPQLQRLLLLENGALLAAGLALGIVAAAVAVLPALLSPNAQLPYASLAVTLGAVLVNGALWTWAATRFAVRGDLLNALRNE